MSSNTLVSSSVSASGVPATYSLKQTHKKRETAAEAINIGNLNSESVIVSVSDKGSKAATAVSTSFVAKSGTVSLSDTLKSYVDIIYTRFQLTNGSGTVIADNEGATDQQNAYAKWVSGTLAIDAGTYTVTATPDAEYPGTTALAVSSSEQQGTSLEVKSTLTGSDTSEYYKFSLSGTNIKLDFDAGKNAGSTRVVLYDKNNKIVADSAGNSYLRSKYTALTSGTGLSATSGDYTAKVTYAANADTTKDVAYDFKLYSGNTYAAVYTSTVKAQAYDPSAKGSVDATSDAKLYETTAYNKIVTDVSKAVNIGWIQQDKSMLDVYSKLTRDDNKDYYSFTLQQGNNLKFDFNTSTTKNVSGIRVQLMNSTGTYVYADSAGTAAQRALYKQLTSSTGIDAKTGGYVIKITYADGATKSDTPYEFGVYSGSSYSAKYKTTASAQTYANALLSGQVGGSTAASSGIAAYLTSRYNKDDSYLGTTLAAALKSRY